MEMEIKALLVDDEEQCVKTLQDGIDWRSLALRKLSERTTRFRPGRS